MPYFDFSNSALSLLPAVIAILLAVTTRQVLFSLGIGIISGALLLTGLSIANSLNYTIKTIVDIFWSQNGFNADNINMVLFMLLLGILISQMTLSGATIAFANWAVEKCKSRRRAKSLTALLVFIFFIDDFFHCISVGSICRPVTDKFRISRAKLAYLLDSTAAPVCVLMPISSWGAYIIAVIAGIFSAHAITDMSAIEAFIKMIPMNLYAALTLAMVLFIVVSQTDIGLMKKQEVQALKGKLWDDAHGAPASFDVASDKHGNGTLVDLILPMLVLVISTIFFMFDTGKTSLLEDGQSISLLSTLEHANLGKSLVYAALLSVVVSALLSLRLKLEIKSRLTCITSGCAAMLSPIIILIFAWSISAVIRDMQTGIYLAQLVDGKLSPALLPATLFLLSCLMAFATGTSWGTFGIMLPLAGDIAVASDVNLMLPMLGAVLAGAVFGDHSSPISSTSILSARGAGCHHMDHVATQLPYAIIAACGAVIGYLVMGFSHSVALGVTATACWFIGYCAYSLRYGRIVDQLEIQK
ncbi:Na+/H+ antiporter NhaC family protein [Vibrio alfacsensis]|uniref:Na+/H+ antiporter NhaC family protein n=1 Tax=Vibrio alfacsensis TaxID=1074311 RepID=UPI001BEF3538|nr:Na+/H+ antiporter NhaC family protein [Vibrio alfacsensis]BCN25892.1 Na+/H+ antiporter [Vibrio alfacsensis]